MTRYGIYTFTYLLYLDCEGCMHWYWAVLRGYVYGKVDIVWVQLLTDSVV